MLLTRGIIFMRKQNVILLIASLLFSSFAAFGNAEVQEKLPLKDSIQSNILTIYKDATLIQQIRSISPEAGKDGYSFQGIPSSICPESFMISSSAKENSFEISEFSLAPAAAGTSDLGMILSFKNTTPNLLKQIQLLYLFKNLDWHIDYALYFSANYEDVKLNAWIEVNNQSGVAFSKAQIQFIDCSIPASFVALSPVVDSAKADMQLHKEETHVMPEHAYAYVCDRLIDIPASGAKRISWVNSQGIKAKQDYRLFVGGAYLEDMEGKTTRPMVETWLSFQNTKEQTLGQPLPKGEATLYHSDEKGAIEVLGKALIPHTAVGQEVSVKVPATQAEKNFTTTNDNKTLRSFETELEQTEFKKLSDKITEASYRLNLKNKANQPITIRVTLDLPQGEWTVVRENISHQQNGDQQVFWTIQIGANSEVDLKYRVRLIRS